MRPFLTVMTIVVASCAGLSHAAIIYGPGAPNKPVDTPIWTSDSHTTEGFYQQATSALAMGAGQDIQKLTFWGTFGNKLSPPTNQQFSLRIWGPPALKPGENPLIYAQTISPTRSFYGTNSTNNIDFYQYVVNFATPIPIAQTGNYFLSVVNETSGTGSDLWGWASTTSNSDPNRYRFSVSDGWITGTGNLAFQTEHAPEPGSIAVLSISSIGLAFGAWRRRRKQQATPA